MIDRSIRNSWRRTEARFWRQVATKVEPHLPQGIHIDGINVKSDEAISGFTISGVTARAAGQRPAITIEGPPRTNGFG